MYGVDGLKANGAVCVEHLDDVPDDLPVILSAHGVPKSVPEAASARGLEYLDATCPLVSKVHRQAAKMVTEGRHILFVGHRGHPEVIGTFGQVPARTTSLVETAAAATAIEVTDPSQLALMTQTPPSVDPPPETAPQHK